MNEILTQEKSIYLQISDMIKNDILRDIILEEERVPSTNEFAKLYAINPATAAKGVNILIEEGSFYFLILETILIVSAMSFGDAYCPTLVSFGAARKPAAGGMLLSQHLFMLEQLTILFVLAALIENSKTMQAIRICPLGTAALLVLILGIGSLINAISLNGHRVCAGITMTIVAGLAIAFVVVMGVKCDFEINVEVFRPYNSLGLLLAGLAVDFVGVFMYFKAVSKVDLKLS